MLAAKYSEKNGFEFVTWKQNADGKAVFWGDYSPSYEYAKESFAVRSGLIPESRLFSEQETANLCRCVDFAKGNCETLTYEQEQQLDKLEEKLLYGYPSKPNRRPLNTVQNRNRICNSFCPPTEKSEGFFYFTRRRNMTIFSDSPYDRRMERLMTTVPNFKPRGTGFRFDAPQKILIITTAARSELLTDTMRQIRCPPFRKRFNEYIESEENPMTYINEKHRARFISANIRNLLRLFAEIIAYCIVIRDYLCYNKLQYQYLSR